MSYSTTTPYSPAPSSSPYARRPSQYPPRATPPSSTFFSSRPDDEHEMQPVADAERHFGSSSSFRRHTTPAGPVSPPHNSGFPAFESIRSTVVEQGPSGIWDKLVGLVNGVKSGDSPGQNGYELAHHKVAEQTPSSKYSSCDAEVRSSFTPYFFF